MPHEARSRGHLNPGSDATVARFPAPADLADAVVHFWVPEWRLPPGKVSRQVVLTYPAVNLVVEPDAPRGRLTLHGPHTRMSERILEGSSWAVGALLRPAAAPAILALAGQSTRSPRAVIDAFVWLDDAQFVSDVVAAMALPRRGRLAAAVDVFAAWLRKRLVPAGVPDRDGLLANALLDLMDALPAASGGHRSSEQVPHHVAEVARRLGTSSRTLERVALAYTGFTPAALIRRRRLQEAAERLRDDPALELAELAHELGYADHAHLTRDFRQVLGFTPSSYRDGHAVAED